MIDSICVILLHEWTGVRGMDGMIYILFVTNCYRSMEWFSKESLYMYPQGDQILPCLNYNKMDEFCTACLFLLTTNAPKWSPGLIHCILVDFSVVICWKSPFVILGVLALLCRFYSIFDGKSCLQTM